MSRLSAIICLDGCGPEYLASADTPNLNRMAKSGWSGITMAMMPTVTNVNNVSLLTGEFPAAHGITGNYYIDAYSGEGIFMESPDFVLCPTIFETLAGQGWTSAMVTTKDKLRSFGRGAKFSVSAENPPAWLTASLGPPPGIYTAEVNLWMLKAAIEIARACRDLRFLFAATSDYVMHTFEPSHEKSQRYLHDVDQHIGALIDSCGDEIDIVVTADHGMNAKQCGLDLQRIIYRNGLETTVVPIIKDRYTVHHQNLGGAAYVYLHHADCAEDVRALLEETPGVERALSRQAAAEEFCLHPCRIGNLMVLADRETVFGSLSAERVGVEVRSHGSQHERHVPVITYGKYVSGTELHYNKDALSLLMTD